MDWSSGESAFVSGRRWCNKKIAKEKDKEKIYDKEMTLQTLKTNDMKSKVEALKSFAAVKDQLFTFYQARWITKQRFHLHRRISSSKAQIANIFVNRVRQLEKLGSVVVALGPRKSESFFWKGQPLHSQQDLTPFDQETTRWTVPVHRRVQDLSKMF